MTWWLRSLTGCEVFVCLTASCSLSSSTSALRYQADQETPPASVPSITPQRLIICVHHICRIGRGGGYIIHPPCTGINAAWGDSKVGCVWSSHLTAKRSEDCKNNPGLDLMIWENSWGEMEQMHDWSSCCQINGTVNAFLRLFSPQFAAVEPSIILPGHAPYTVYINYNPIFRFLLDLSMPATNR